jgi:hypothetical protein
MSSAPSDAAPQRPGLIFGDVSILAISALVAITIVIAAVTFGGAKYFSSSVRNVALPKSPAPYPGTFAPADLAAARAAVAARADALSHVAHFGPRAVLD